MFHWALVTWNLVLHARRQSASLARSLPIAPRLVRIDFAHAFEEVLGIGFFDFRVLRSIASAAGRGRNDRTWFLNLVRHGMILVVELRMSSLAPFCKRQ